MYNADQKSKVPKRNKTYKLYEIHVEIVRQYST